MEKHEKRDIWKMFDRISPTYDKVNRILSLGRDRQWRQTVSRFLPEGKNLRLLDLATGTGDQLIALFESSASIASAIGIDLSNEMMEIGKEKIGHKTYSNRIEWRRADAEELPFEANTFDAATFSFGIRNVTDPRRSLTEIYRTLKPKGRCLILEFSLPPQPMKTFFLLYLRHILPRVGGYLSKAPSAYRYLNQTIETFPSGRSFCQLLQEAKFRHVSLHRMALGAVTLYVGEKG